MGAEHNPVEVGTTKNGEGRIAASTPELQLLCYKWQPTRDYRKAWENACEKAGLVGMLRHDFRRSAVRNMKRAGVPQSHAMKVTGHKTESIYKQNAIVGESDMADVTPRLLGHRTGPNPSVTVDTSSVSGQYSQHAGVAQWWQSSGFVNWTAAKDPL